LSGTNTSLLRTFVNYERKRFYNTDTRTRSSGEGKLKGWSKGPGPASQKAEVTETQTGKGVRWLGMKRMTALEWRMKCSSGQEVVSTAATCATVTLRGPDPSSCTWISSTRGQCY